MFRKMRRFKQAISKEACETVLREARRGVLAVQGDDGYPYTVPMNFYYEDDAIYFHSAVAGHKVDAMKTNEHMTGKLVNEV